MVAIPSVEHEQLRDLVRCREDIRADLMRARHRLGKFLLRREIYNDLGDNYFVSREDPDRRARRLVAQLEQLGFKVTLEAATAA